MRSNSHGSVNSTLHVISENACIKEYINEVIKDKLLEFFDFILFYFDKRQQH